jgi:hypothetical protein
VLSGTWCGPDAIWPLAALPVARETRCRGASSVSGSAEHLYGTGEWTMARLGKALGVSKAAISGDLWGSSSNGTILLGNGPMPHDRRLLRAPCS